MKFLSPRVVWLALALAWLDPGPAAAQLLPEASLERVAEIRVQGNARVESDAVINAVKAKTGEPYKLEDVRRDVQTLHELGYFSDIAVDFEESPKGLVVTFIVAEKPMVAGVKVTGNDDLDIEEINKVVDVRPSSILDISRIKQNTAKIQELYTQKGFLLAEVRFRLEDAGENQKNVYFDITENAKVMVRKIRLLGNRKVDDDTIKQFLETKEGNYFSFMNDSGAFREDVFQKDQMIIRAYYNEQGYIYARTGRPRVSLTPDRKYLNITIPVEEGEQYFLGEVSFAGELIGTEKEHQDRMTLKPGDVFARSRLQDDINNKVGLIYRNEGYAYVNLIPSFNIDEKTRRVSISYDIQRGKKVYYERIEVIGNTRTRDRVIRRQLRIVEGELSNASRMERSRALVQALGFFETVEVLTKRGSSDELMTVQVKVKEKQTGTFQIGAGLSSVENFILQAQIAQFNLFGRGQSLQLQAQISSLRQIFDLRFTEPNFLDSNWFTSAVLYNRQENFLVFLRTATGAGLTVGYPFTDEFSLFFTYNLETVKAEALDTRRLRVKNLLQDGVTSSLTSTIQYDTRNNRLFPSAGQLHLFSVEAAPPFLGSQNQFMRFNAITRWYFPMFWGTVFKTNLNVGYITSLSPQGVPIYEKYFLGGVNSLRGYFLRSVSPVTRVSSNGQDPISPLETFGVGGDKQLTLNVEFEYPIFDPLGLRGVFFFDAGNAYAENEFFFQDKGEERGRGVFVNRPPIGLLMSTGFGVRWFSPLGPLRFEWGIPLYRRIDPVTGQVVDDPIIFEFTIGTLF
ncbi:MAG: Outer membrane protein assembly factor BamA [Myxococcota bacterium]|nr:Outer membrane protein assembly factor BamA [Myxococcota bacterium]